MKKLKSFLLSIVMIFSLVPTIAFAATTGVEFAVDTSALSEGVKAGNTIVVPVNISANAGITMANITLDYDDNIFDTVSIEGNSDFGGSYQTNGKIVVWEADDLTVNVETTALFLTVTLTVKEGVTAGEYTIKVKDFDLTNADYEAVEGSCVEGSVKVEYETVGLVFANGNGQDALTYDQVKAEAEGAEGAVSLTTPGENHYFAGWFTSLDVTADDNGFYVIDPSTATTFNGTEFRPRYENPPTEGTYNALWIKGDSSSVYALSLGTTNTVHLGTDGSTVLGAAISAANGSRTKLVSDMTLSTVINTTVPLHLDMNGRTITAGANNILTLGANGNTAESSRAGGTFAGSKTQYFNLTWNADYSAPAGSQFTLIRDITMNGSKSGKVIYISSATKIENCVFEGYLDFVDTNSTAIDNCKITTSTMLIKSEAGEVTVTNSEMTSTGTYALMQGYGSPSGYAGTIKLGAGNKITATSATPLFNNLASAVFTSTDSTYQIKAGGNVVGNGTVTYPTSGMAAAIDANGYVIFGEPCTVTYMADGNLVATKTAVKDGYADLTVTHTFGDGKQYKLLGWSTEENSTEPMDQVLLTGNTATLYAVKGRKGVLLGTGATEYLSGDQTYSHSYYNSSTVSRRTFTIYNADQLSLLNSLTLKASSYASIYFNAEALASIADQITGTSKDIAVTFYYPTSGLTEGVLGHLEFAIKYGETPVAFGDGVEARFKVSSTNGIDYKKFEAYNTSDATNTIAAVTKKISGNYFSCFPLSGNGTYEVMQVPGFYLNEAQMSGNVSVTMGTTATELIVENADKLAEMSSLYISGNSVNTTFSEEALDSIAAKADGSITVNVENVTPSENGVARAELSVKDNDGNPVDFEGAVEVTIIFPFTEGKNYRVYYIPETGEPVGLTTTIADHSSTYKKATFTTTHFSAFEVREVEAVSINTEDIFENKTGSTTPATINAPADGWVLNEENTFTVSCDKACVVGYTTDGETYIPLTAGDDGYTVTLTEGMKIVVAIAGDVNGDGLIRVADVIAAAQLEASGECTSYQMLLADMTGDGNLRVADVIALAQLESQG